MKIISEKARDIAGDENALSEDEIAKTFANIAELNADFNSGESESNSELNKIMPLMSNIMENLLSKDFLYPTLSDLRKKVYILIFFFNNNSCIYSIPIT